VATEERRPRIAGINDYETQRESKRAGQAACPYGRVALESEES
jgi:hypothetical protein